MVSTLDAQEAHIIQGNKKCSIVIVVFPLVLIFQQCKVTTTNGF